MNRTRVTRLTGNRREFPVLKSTALVALLVGLAWVNGCGGGQAEPGSANSTSASSRTVDASTAGSVAGTVTLDGSPATMQPIDTSSDPNCTGGSPIFPQTVVMGLHGELANVVVYVKGGVGDYRFDTPSDHITLDQKGCTYAPHVLALMVNQPFQIDNDDMTVHNVHPESKVNDSWNRSQPAGAPPVVTTYTHPELAIPVMCNVHPWMRSYLFVFAHPYFAVTSAAGKFDLRNLPPGSYTIEAWHEKYGLQDQVVTVGPKESQEISFHFGQAAGLAR